MPDYEKIFIKFTGKDIKNRAVPIDFLGNFLRSFQTFFRNIARIDAPNLKSNWLRLILTSIESGSAVIEFQLKQPRLLMPHTYKTSMETSKELLKIIQQEDADSAYREIQKKIKLTSKRIAIYRSLKKVWSTQRITTSVGSGSSLETADFIDLDKTYKKRLNKWLKKEYFKGVITMKGFLIRIKTDDTPFFTVINEFGDKIVVYFELEELSKVKDLLTKPIILKGLIETVRNQKTIKEGATFKELVNYKVSKTKNYKFKKPLIFKLQYFEDGILATEDYIPLNLDLEILSDLNQELDSYLEFLEETYILGDINKLTPKAQELRKRLIHLLDNGEK